MKAAYMKLNNQNTSVVLFYKTIAQPKTAMLMGIVYTPPHRFHPTNMTNPIISKCYIIYLRIQWNCIALLCMISQHFSYYLLSYAIFSMLTLESITYDSFIYSSSPSLLFFCFWLSIAYSKESLYETFIFYLNLCAISHTLLLYLLRQ